MKELENKKPEKKLEKIDEVRKKKKSVAQKDLNMRR